MDSFLGFCRSGAGPAGRLPGPAFRHSGGAHRDFVTQVSYPFHMAFTRTGLVKTRSRWVFGGRLGLAFLGCIYKASCGASFCWGYFHANLPSDCLACFDIGGVLHGAVAVPGGGGRPTDPFAFASRLLRILCGPLGGPAGLDGFRALAAYLPAIDRGYDHVRRAADGQRSAAGAPSTFL